MARTDSDPLSLVAAVRGEVQAVDKDQPISQIRTMEELVADRSRNGASTCCCWRASPASRCYWRR